MWRWSRVAILTTDARRQSRLDAPGYCVAPRFIPRALRRAGTPLLGRPRTAVSQRAGCAPMLAGSQASSGSHRQRIVAALAPTSAVATGRHVYVGGIRFTDSTVTVLYSELAELGKCRETTVFTLPGRQ